MKARDVAVIRVIIKALRGADGVNDHHLVAYALSYGITAKNPATNTREACADLLEAILNKDD